MSDSNLNPTQTAMLAVGLATLAMTALFVGMIWDFRIALFLAAVFSAMATPLHQKILSMLGGRTGLATTVTLLTLVTCVLVPTFVLVYVATA